MGKNHGRVLGLELLCPGNLSHYGSRFNLVIVAEGYGGRSECCRADANQFAADANRIVHQLRTTAPFMSHFDVFNIFLLHVHSDQEGADRGNTLVDTYFDARFAGPSPDSGLPPQLLLVDEGLVHETVAAQFKELSLRCKQELGLPHKIIVLVNTRYDGGSGGSVNNIAVASRALDIRTVLHELGHTFGLVDEYPHAGAGAGPNLSAVDAPLPWAGLMTLGAGPVDFDTVGAFKDPELAYVRSQWLCQMRYCCHPAFCAACSSHVGEQLEKFSP